MREKQVENVSESTRKHTKKENKSKKEQGKSAENKICYKIYVTVHLIQFSDEFNSFAHI